MKNLLRFLAFVLMVVSAHAQSNLPACQGSDITRWNRCFGTSTYSNGDVYVGEYISGWRYGKGTLFRSNGSVINHGIWDNDKFSRTADIFSVPPVPFVSVVNQTVATATVQPNTSLSYLPPCQGSDQRKWNSCIFVR
jgi:hypothetical protein